MVHASAGLETELTYLSCQSKDLALVNATKLRVDIQSLFVERLEKGIDKAAEGWVVNLLHDFRTGFSGICEAPVRGVRS